MKAYVVSQPGSPEVLELKELPNPIAKSGEVLIKIKAFGLNRAEAVTRMGGSFGAVKFPKVIGIECVGEVLDCPSGKIAKGQTVAAAMGGMGRDYNGSYAEMTVVPESNVFPIKTSLDWEILGSIPETYFTARGCIEALQLGNVTKPKVLVRPGASALGIAITQIVNHLDGEVIGVTRSEHKRQKLINTGMKEVIVSNHAIANEVLSIWPKGADGIVDTIVSQMSIKDDFTVKNNNAFICLAGSLAESYETSPHEDFKSALKDAKVTYFSSEELHVDKDGENLQKIVNLMEEGVYKPHIDSVFSFDELVIAHQKMDKNQFAGKVVITV